MTRVIGVRFRTAGRIYFFDPLDFKIEKGDHVIVETARGIEYGTAASGITEVEDEKVVQPLKPVIRIANGRDTEQEEGNREKEKEAFRICMEKIREHGLAMKLVGAEYTFDNSKVLFYFTADGRIDFRELVKDLAGVFRTRIELRQIGVRDETKIMGGIGTCGRPLCCHSYLADFVPVSIKMAKEQNLSLNPTKISGVCGRLMCCLKNEEETYEELNRRLPGIGDTVTTENGTRGEVQSVNVLRQLVKVVIDAGDEKEIKEYPVEKLRFRRRHSKKEKMELSQEELQELERLEEEEQQEQELQENAGKKEGGQRQGGRNRQENRNRHGGRTENAGSAEGELFPADAQRSSGTQRPADSRRNGDAHKNAGAKRYGEANGRAEQRSGGRQGGYKQSGQRSGGQKAFSQRQTGELPEEAGRQQERRQPEGELSSESRRGDNGNRQEGRRRQQYPNSGERHGTRNRRDGRNRHDAGAGREEQPKVNGDQA